MLRLLAIPLPVRIYALVMAAVALLIGSALLIWGTLPRWLPSGLLDPQGQPAALSPRVWRTVGAGCGLLGIAIASETLIESRAIVLLAFSLIGIALICLVGAALGALGERRARSLRATRSSARWSVVGFVLAFVLNYGLIFYLFYGSRKW